ncbi:MAG: pyridoxal phosphate-dependent aminotransferase [Chloroflexota bacterium]
MQVSPRREIAGLQAAVHGGIDYAELEARGVDPSQVLDFSANLNPFGPAPSVRRVLREMAHASPDALACYPDSLAVALRRKLAGHLGVDMDNLLMGNGSTELIRLLALGYFGQGDTVIVIGPTFGEYEVACRISGASVVTEKVSPERDFELDVEHLVAVIKRARPKGVFLCNPNNPTGRYLGSEAVGRILEAAPGSLVVLDEAYITFVDATWSSVAMSVGGSTSAATLVVLRSMTKDYGMAGLRLGYAVAERGVISTLRRICPPWNVNAVAQEAGRRALDDEEYLEKTRQELRRAKEFLLEELSSIGLSPVSSEANFFLVRVGDARSLRHELLARGILVRDCASFGIGGYLRIAARSMDDCRRLIAALEEVRAIHNGGIKL